MHARGSVINSSLYETSSLIFARLVESDGSCAALTAITQHAVYRMCASPAKKGQMRALVLTMVQKISVFNDGFTLGQEKRVNRDGNVEGLLLVTSGPL